MDEAERTQRRDSGNLTRHWALSGARACKLLYDAGASDEEVDLILGSHIVPLDVDEDWANRRRAWYVKATEGGGL